MTNRDDFTRQAQRARKAMAYSIAQRAEAKADRSARALRRAARGERHARASYLEALRLADLLES